MEQRDPAFALARQRQPIEFFSADGRRYRIAGSLQLTIHHSRHTFISHALAGGRTLAELRDAAGHSNVSVTSAYLHVALDGEEGPGELFRF